MCLFMICVPLMAKILFKLLAYFYWCLSFIIFLFVFSLLSFENYLCIMDTNPLWRCIIFNTSSHLWLVFSFSLQISLCSILLHSANYSSLLNLRRSAPEIHCAQSWFPLCVMAKKFFQSSKLGNCRAYFNCFPFLRVYCISLPDVQYLENYCVIYFPNFYFIFRQEDKSGPHYFTLARIWSLECDLCYSWEWILEAVFLQTFGRCPFPPLLINQNNF